MKVCLERTFASNLLCVRLQNIHFGGAELPADTIPRSVKSALWPHWPHYPQVLLCTCLLLSTNISVEYMLCCLVSAVATQLTSTRCFIVCVCSCGRFCAPDIALYQVMHGSRTGLTSHTYTMCVRLCMSMSVSCGSFCWLDSQNLHVSTLIQQAS